ncbi:MAG: PAS domain-containing protein, partial [Candidatus Peregrinibacteria bacterium]|nr:PAS domain-containing protein [Candidatus Peregrinibacteria bacterium]
DDGTMLGTMCVRYSLEDFITVLYSAPGMGQTEQVLLGSLSNDEIIVITENHVSGKFTFLETGDFRQALKANMPMAGALTQSNGTTIGYDYTGHRVLAAYVGIPELQWGLVAKIHYEEAMRDVFILSLILVMISVLLIVLAGYLAYIFARSLTNPIISLSKTMSALGPSTNWTMKKSLATGDEVEVLENVAADMAMRLKCVYEDMEEEIEARTEELRQQYRKDSAILKSIDYGVVMTDANGIITEANPAARDYIQNAKQEYQGKHIADTVIIQSGKQGQGGVHPVIETLKTKQSIRSTPDVHFSIVRSDNLLIPVTLSCVPLMSGATVVGAILVFQDATEQRRVDYLKSEFISLASHQLRTPLSSMQWYIELFGDEKGMSKIQKEYLAEMRTAAKRMTSLIDALLHSARLETQDITPQVAPVDAVALLEDLCSEFRTMGRKKHITCNITLPKKKVIIETDSVLLHVAFKNLFSNAIKYTPENGKVSVSMRDTARAIEVVVTDTGIGIPKKEQKRIFERLFRASNARKMDTDGNGLGLYITKMIVESFGGTLRITSTEKKGTTVTLTLPKTMKKQKE